MAQIFSFMPESVAGVAHRLRDKGYELWLVGGAVRDYLLEENPADWDFSTNASPERLQEILSPSYRVVTFGLRHGTIHVVTQDGLVEITSWMANGYGDAFKDLARRDFTINAMAVTYPDGKLVDPFRGRKDLGAKRLRGVGNPLERFDEDPVRLLRAARFVSRYGFRVSPKTVRAMRSAAPCLTRVAVERVRAEIWKLLVGPHVVEALELCRRTGLTAVFFPELLEGWKKKQNAYHRYDIYRHTLQCVQFSPLRLRVRLAALLHDIGKPRVRRKVRGAFRFYGHEKLSAHMASEILARWLTPKKLAEEVVTLVENHMVHSTDSWKDGAVRRLIHRVGPSLMEDFLDLLRADRRAHGTTDEPLKDVERLSLRIRRILDEAPVLTPKALAINGRDVMSITGVAQGPEVGRILQKAFHMVLQDPAKNNRSFLLRWLQEESFKKVPMP